MTKASKVKCPVCGKLVAVTKELRLRHHLNHSGQRNDSIFYPRCEGSGKQPPTVDLLAALQESIYRAKDAAAEAVRNLDAIEPGDPEKNHGDADAIVLSVVPDVVREAYWRTCERDVRWWWA